MERGEGASYFSSYPNQFMIFLPIELIKLFQEPVESSVFLLSQ